MHETAKGSCLCEQLSFTVKLPVKWAAHCHCSICRAANGAAFVTWFGVPEENFEINSGHENLAWYSHTEGAERGFCNCCGSSVFFRSRKWPDEMHLTLANMKQPIKQSPETNAYFNTHVEWANFDQLKKISEDGSEIK
jgi:hypothetical protein